MRFFRNSITFFSSSIKTKIMSIFILISILSVLVISMLSIIQLKKVFTQKSIVDYGKIAEELFYNINRQIIKGKTDINIITNNPVIISNSATANEKLSELHKLQNTLKIYEDLTILDPTGLVITSTRYSYRGDWRYKKHFLECLKGKTIVSNVQAIRSPEKYIIDFTSPVFNDKGEITSVIAAQLDMKNISDITTHVELGKTGHAFLLNADHKVIAHRKKETIFSKPHQSFVNQIKSREKLLHFSGVGGEAFVGIFFDRLKSGSETMDYQEDMDWIVVIVQNKNEMFSPLNEIVWRIAFYSLIIGGIVVVLAILFSHSITDPIKQLTDGAVALGKGNLRHRVQIDTNDELKQLSGSFNKMAENLYDSREETVKTLERLKQRETDLNKAQSIAHVGSWEWHLVDNSFHLSDEVCSICGIDDANMYSDIWDMINQTVHPDDKKSGYAQIEKAMQFETADKLIYRIVRPGGELRWIEATPPDVNRFADDGTPLSFLGTIQDITKRKKAEDALRESEEKYRQLVENIGEEYFFYSYDTDRVLFYVSRSMTKMLGYERNEFVANFSSYLTANTINRDIAKTSGESVKGIRQPPYLIEILHKSGEIRFLEVTESPVFDMYGKVVVVEGIAHDITKRKQVEDELHQLRNYLTNIIDSMPSILIGVEAVGMVTQWNHEAVRATGISTKDALSQPIEKVFPRLGSEMGNISAAIQSREVYVSTNQAYLEEAKTHYETITIYPLVASDIGGIDGAVIRVDDVTEKVQMEEVLIQSEKMLSVGGLAAGMAHEINNPLAGIMQTANVMSNRLEDLDLPANVKAAEAAGTNMGVINNFMKARDIPRMLTAIAESGLRVTEIVGNMLSFSRQSGSAASSHCLTKLMDKSLELAAVDYDLKKHHDFKMIEIKKEYDDNIPPVMCEGAEIQQVIMNILRNGAQAMQEVKVAKPMFIFRIWFDKDCKMACLEIEDNGPGMDEETRKRVFEPFFTTKPVGIGTGLGLSVSYFIITENHEGEMSVESRPGVGTTFTIRLPLESVVKDA